MRIALLHPTYWPEVRRGLRAPRARPRRGARPPRPRGHPAHAPIAAAARSSGPTGSRSCAPGGSRGSPGCTGTTSTRGRSRRPSPGSSAAATSVVHALYPVDGWSARLAQNLGGPPYALSIHGVVNREYLVRRRHRLEMLRAAAAGAVARERPLRGGGRTAAPLRARRPGRSSPAAWSRPTTPGPVERPRRRRCSARRRSTIRASAGALLADAFGLRPRARRRRAPGARGRPRAGSRARGIERIAPGDHRRPRRRLPRRLGDRAALRRRGVRAGAGRVAGRGHARGRRALGRLPGDRRRRARSGACSSPATRRTSRARSARPSSSPPTRRPPSAAARTPGAGTGTRVVERYEALYAAALG